MILAGFSLITLSPVAGQIQTKARRKTLLPRLAAALVHPMVRNASRGRGGSGSVQGAKHGWEGETTLVRSPFWSGLGLGKVQRG